MNISMLITIIPVIITLIKTVEDIVPGDGEGEKKLAAVREMLETIYGTFGSFGPIVEKIVSIIVKLFNKTGQFQTAVKNAAPEAPVSESYGPDFSVLDNVN